VASRSISGAMLRAQRRVENVYPAMYADGGVAVAA
jgi:hypothetical protein